MDIGILGGTFDPIHLGHIKMAEAAYNGLALDKVLFMPTSNPPHKTGITDSEHRINMIRLAIKDYKHFEMSDIEIMRKGIIYTADTLEYLTKTYPDNRYIFIMGADSLFDITKWFRPDKVMEYATLAVCARDDADPGNLYDYREFLVEKYNADIVILNFSCVDISSSKIRTCLYTDYSMVKDYISEEVYNYIIKEGLYRDEI